ncbi:MAG: ABC transporter permease [Chloroflexi bacterium]|nr:ABC transporter permease [Chloroflexota bacterium]
MRTTVRLVWKQHRFEFIAVLGALIVLTIFTLEAWSRLRSIQPPLACLPYWLENGMNGPGCDMAAWIEARENGGGNLVGYSAFLPMIGGALLGSLLVAREIEHRTAQLAWSLSPSRGRWLTERVLPVLVPFVIVLIALAIAAELVVAAKGPDVDPRMSFEDYGGRGLPVVMRGLAVFAVALLAGAVLGRQIPALLAGAVAIFVVYTVMGSAFPFGVEGEWQRDDQQISDRWGQPDRYLDFGFVMPDGHYASWEEAKTAAPPGSDPGEWVFVNLRQVSRVLSGTHLTEVELRESLLLGVVVVAGLAGTGLVVSRRRPY